MTFERETCTDFDRSSALEWLEANGLGGWASSTVSGAHTRRYHGLLVAATEPPVGRKVLLSRLDETIEANGETFDLGANRFPGAIHPRGFEHIARFRQELFPTWEYEVGGQRFTGEAESAAPIFRKADLPPARVTVFYDPEKPAFSRPSQHSDGGGVRSWFIFAGVVAVVGVLLLAIPMLG